MLYTTTIIDYTANLSNAFKISHCFCSCMRHERHEQNKYKVFYVQLLLYIKDEKKYYNTLSELCINEYTDFTRLNTA